YHANRTSTAPMTKEEIEQVMNRVELENEAALIQILPSSKHEALKKALKILHDQMRKESASEE
ncbi:MAG: hypothetical protein ACAI34_00415, partial [Verrucomicrobium sp.]